jgi:hypothetical protein
MTEEEKRKNKERLERGVQQRKKASAEANAKRAEEMAQRKRQAQAGPSSQRQVAQKTSTARGEQRRSIESLKRTEDGR